MRFSRARSPGTRARIGAGFAFCGRGVSVPTSTKPKPSAPRPSKCSASLSSPAATPSGDGNLRPKASTRDQLVVEMREAPHQRARARASRDHVEGGEGGRVRSLRRDAGEDQVEERPVHGAPIGASPRPPGSAHRSAAELVPRVPCARRSRARSRPDRCPPAPRPHPSCSCRARTGSPRPSPRRGTGSPRRAADAVALHAVGAAREHRRRGRELDRIAVPLERIEALIDRPEQRLARPASVRLTSHQPISGRTCAAPARPRPRRSAPRPGRCRAAGSRRRARRPGSASRSRATGDDPPDADGPRHRSS